MEIVSPALNIVMVIVLLVFAKRLHGLTSELNENTTRLEATVDRMEAATFVVAENLASSVSRADATEGAEGAAADAALRTGDSAAAIHARQEKHADRVGRALIEKRNEW